MNKAAHLAWYALWCPGSLLPAHQEHPQIVVSAYGVSFLCDELIAPLVRRINRMKGVATRCSCQGGSCGAYVYMAVDPERLAYVKRKFADCWASDHEEDGHIACILHWPDTQSLLRYINGKNG